MCPGEASTGLTPSWPCTCQAVHLGWARHVILDKSLPPAGILLLVTKKGRGQGWGDKAHFISMVSEAPALRSPEFSCPAHLTLSMSHHAPASTVNPSVIGKGKDQSLILPPPLPSLIRKKLALRRWTSSSFPDGSVYWGGPQPDTVSLLAPSCSHKQMSSNQPTGQCRNLSMAPSLRKQLSLIKSVSSPLFLRTPTGIKIHLPCG